MREKPIRFRLCLAEMLFDVSCCFAGTRDFCRDFLTEDAGDAHPIVITPADIEAERPRLTHRLAEGQQVSPENLEALVLLRKIALMLPRHDRTLFHGSGLAFDGKGVLFTARSGTGKSTHTGLWRQVFGQRVTMVNDDKPFLHFTPDGVRLCGTPWRGKHNLGRNISVPLTAVCYVCRGTENRIEPLDPREALPLLLQQIFYPDDPGDIGRMLGLAERLTRQVKLYRLTCNMDPEAAQVACQGIDFD